MQIFGEFARIWLSVAYVTYGLIIFVTLAKHQTILSHIIMVTAFLAATITFWHSIIGSLNPWPAVLAAVFITEVTLGLFKWRGKLLAALLDQQENGRRWTDG